LDKAIEHLETALSEFGDDSQLLHLLGEIHQQAHHKEQAALNFRKAVDLDPKNPTLWKMLSEANLALGFFQEADQAAVRFAKSAPKTLEPLTLRIRIAMQGGETSKAMKLIEQASRESSLTPELYSLQSRLEREMGSTSKAIQSLDRAIQTAEVPLPYLIERADLVGEQDGAQAKLSTLVALSKQYPGQARIYHALGKTLFGESQEIDAIRAYQKALKAADEKLEAHEKSCIHFELGALLSQKGHLDQALTQFSQAIQLDPQNADNYLALGKVHARRREFNHAVQAFETALELSPDDSSAYIEIAQVLKEAKNYSRAEQMLRHATQLDPDNLEAHRLLSAIMTLNLVHNAEVIV
jgi:tetratricopeptide (TPR) repeat protein